MFLDYGRGKDWKSVVLSVREREREMGTYRMFMCFARKLRITEQAPPADVKAIFQEFTEGGTRMTAEQLHRFLVEFQGDGWASMAKAEEIVEQVLQRRHHIARFTRHTLSLDDFFHYLFSEDLNPPLGDKVHQDMTVPLSHYFIYTGHNSYLTGNQLSSECSDVPIIKALKRGLRVVELDLWPNSTKDNVLVLHGWTLTSPVDLMKCLKSIKEYAFLASPYPVILTLEDHLTPHLQAKVAQMINQSFGDMVFYPESQGLEEFPSPEELKYRIIISTKLPKEHRQAKSYKNRRIHSQKERNSDEDVSVKEPSDPAAVQEDDKKSDCLTSKQNEYDENINNAEDQESRVLGVLAYKRLISIPSRSAKTSLKEALNVESDKVRRLSFGELKFEKATALYGTDVLRFTQKNLLRIYPKGTRVTSSNYKPLTGWMHGAQMVAFNMQGYGRSLWLMHGMFRANGGCGYVKKPDFLMNACPDDRFLDPKAKFPVKKNLKVKVCIGYGWHLNSKKTQFNLWSPPDFYTRVGIAGVPADKTMKRTKTQRDSWTPVWDEEFIFPLTVPELALLRVEVHDYNMSEKDDFAGQTCLPVSELKPGIRAVPLFDRKGEQLVSVRLLMRFEFI